MNFTVLDLCGRHIGSAVVVRSPNDTRHVVRGVLRSIKALPVDGQDEPIVKLRVEIDGGVAKLTLRGSTLADVASW